MRTKTICCLLSLFLLVSVSDIGRAEVTYAAAEGFVVDVEITINATPQRVYRRLVGNIADWWESSHTYSGDAKNLYLEAEPKGWFGEKLPDGGAVQHMEVIFAAPGKTLRLRGALGPLQEHALTGVMTWVLTPEGDNTRLQVTYRVGGFMPGGVKAVAAPVDHVIATQVKRLQRFVESGQANQ